MVFQVAGFETKEGCPITPGCHFQKMFTVLPHVNNKNKFGIALDGKVKVRVNQWSGQGHSGGGGGGDDEDLLCSFSY